MLLAVRGAKIYTGRGDIIEKGMLLAGDDGKILDVGQDTAVPDNAEILDLEGRVIIPGLIDAHTHVGIWGDGEGEPSQDSNEWIDPVTAGVSALNGVNPLHNSFEGAREGGITTVQILPGSVNPVGGLCFACKTAGSIIDDMVIKNPTGLKGAMGENPKWAHGQMQKKAPASRMGIAAAIREFFLRAGEYKVKKNRAMEKGEFFETDIRMESGLMVLDRKIPFRVHAHRHDDIATALRICGEFAIDCSIEHCTDGYLIADYLGKKNTVAMVGPGLSSSSKLETAGFSDENAVILSRHGVKTCLITDHPFLNCRYFLAYASIVHKYGLSLQDTLRAITLSPAEALGIEERTGSLEVGKDADFAVLGGEPFTLKGRVESTFIEGKCVWRRKLY